MSEKGALFPWRTIDGEEASVYYPAGTAQYHINADIIYAMEKYCKATGDTEFLYGQAAEAMYLPYDKKTGIYAQDDSFFEKERWPFEETPVDKNPLLLHYHPLVIYRHQLLKEPDLVLAQFLLSEEFSLE
jgi:trehalose/maltose hydrolase-like predicted phosphorylase